MTYVTVPWTGVRNDSMSGALVALSGQLVNVDSGATIIIADVKVLGDGKYFQPILLTTNY